MLKGLRDVFLMHPWLDGVIAIGVVVCLSWFYLPQKLPEPFITGVSTLAGLILACVTFVATMLLQTSNVLFGKVRKYRETSSNVIEMLIFTLISAILPLLSFLSSVKFVSVVMPLIAGVLVVIEMLRCVWWIYCIFILSINEKRYEAPQPTTESLINQLDQLH